jgi:hypothetical protein
MPKSATAQIGSALTDGVPAALELQDVDSFMTAVAAISRLVRGRMLLVHLARKVGQPAELFPFRGIADVSSSKTW